MPTLSALKMKDAVKKSSQSLKVNEVLNFTTHYGLSLKMGTNFGEFLAEPLH